MTILMVVIIGGRAKTREKEKKEEEGRFCHYLSREEKLQA